MERKGVQENNNKDRQIVKDYTEIKGMHENNNKHSYVDCERLYEKEGKVCKKTITNIDKLRVIDKLRRKFCRKK